jgi:hypothetical protein
MRFLLFAVSLPAFAAPITSTQIADVLSDPITASATYWTNLGGVVEVDSPDYPVGGLSVPIASIPASPEAFLNVTLTVMGAGGLWGFSSGLRYDGFSTYVEGPDPLCIFGNACVTTRYLGSGEIDLTWQPMLLINIDDPMPPTDGPFFASGTFQLEATISFIDPSPPAVPEPSMFAPLVLAYLGLLWRRWRS